MRDIHRVQNMVEYFLRTDKACRWNDSLLYAKICTEIEPNVSLLPFSIVLENRAAYGLPPFETVRRARQKAQADNEDLKPGKGIQEMRKEAEKEFRAYALE